MAFDDTDVLDRGRHRHAVETAIWGMAAVEDYDR